MPFPEYAVVIPHYNDVVRLERCLEALMPQAGEDCEVIVADNNSSQDLSFVLDRYPAARIIVESRKGAGLARNLGVANTTAPWIFFIDADCVPESDWIEVGKRIAKPGTIIGGRVDVFDETPSPKTGAEAFEAVFAFRMRDYFERKAFLGAGNLILPREIFVATGGFRTGVSEDVEWSQRAASMGFDLGYVDEFAVRHPSRSTWSELRRKWRRLASEEFLLRGRSRRVVWMLRGLAMPFSIFAHAPRILRSPALSLGEKARAVLTLARLRVARMFWMLGQASTGRP